MIQHYAKIKLYSNEYLDEYLGTKIILIAAENIDDATQKLNEYYQSKSLIYVLTEMATIDEQLK